MAMTRPIVNLAATGLLLWLLLALSSAPTTAQTVDEESFYTIAVRAYQDGLLDVARDQLQTYIMAFPHGKYRADAHYLLGDYFYRKADFTLAVRHLEEALQRQRASSFDADARYLLGRSHLETGHYPEAVQALQPLIAQGPSGRWYEAALYWTGEAELSLDNAAAAAPLLTQLVEQYPSGEYRENALYSLGYAWQKLAQPERSLPALQRLVQEFPHSSLRRSAEYGAARSLVALQRFAEAVPYWQRLQEQAESPERAEEAAFWEAESWARAERCDRAETAFHAYLTRFAPGKYQGEALIALGECALAAGAPTEADRHIEVFVQQFPTDARSGPLLLRLAETYYQTGQIAPAIQRYSQWLIAFPNDSQRTDILVRRGMLYHLQANYARAVQDLTDVLQRTPGPEQQALAHRMLAEGYWHLDDCTAALPHFAAVINQGPDSERRLARLRRGMCAYRNQQVAAAVEDFNRLVDDAEFAGDRQRLLLLLGQSLVALGRDAEATSRLQDLLAAEPPDDLVPQALAALGASLLKTGQVALALPVYERLLSLVLNLDGKERLHLQLAQLYHEQQAPERARAHLEAAVHSQDAAVAAEALYRLADLLLKAGAEADGKVLLETLTGRSGPPDRWVGIAHYRLALLHEEAQHWPEAWKAYQAAATATTDPSLAEAARGRAKYLEETVDVQPRPKSTAGDDDQRTPDDHKAAQH